MECTYSLISCRKDLLFFLYISLSLSLSLSLPPLCFFFFPSITLLAGRDLCSVLIHSHNAHCLATTNQPSYFWRGPPANQESCAITFSALQSYWRLRTNGVGPEHWDEQNRSALRFWPHQCWYIEGCVNSLRLDQSDSLALVLLSSLQVRLPRPLKSSLAL